MLISKRALLRNGALLAGTAIVPPGVFLLSQPARAQDPFSAIAIIYQAFVTVIGFLDSQKFSRDVRSGLDDIKAQLVIVDQKIDDVLRILRDLPSEIQALLENNNREVASHRISALEKSLIDEFAGIHDLAKNPEKKIERIRILAVELKTEGYYLAEWGPLGYAYVARAFAHCATAFMLLGESKPFLQSFGLNYLKYMMAYRDKFSERLGAALTVAGQNQKEINEYPKVFHLGSFKDECLADVIFDPFVADREPREPRPPRCSNQYNVYFGDLRLGTGERWTGSIGRMRSNQQNPNNWPSPPGVSPGSPDQMHYQAQELLNAKSAIVRREAPIAHNLRPHAKATAEITIAIQEFANRNKA